MKHVRSQTEFAFAVALRAAVTGVLACAAAHLLMTTTLYASAFILVLLAGVTTFDLARMVLRADRAMESAVEAMLLGDLPGASQGSRVFTHALAQLERVMTTLSAARFEQQQRIAHLEALLETVPVAVLAVRANGRISAQNTSARQLLSTLPPDWMSPGTARAAGLAPGARQIVQLPDGRRLLACAAQFSLPGAEPQLLLSLQRVTGELDAVELLAWQEMARVLTHEMMNSLTPIASLSESLEGLVRRARQAPALLDEVAAALEVIQRRSLGLTSFVERYRKVLELPPPKLETLDATRLLDGIGKLMHARFAQQGIVYHSAVLPAGLCFAADPQLLEQALINLLNNASDAVAGCSQPEIELRCEAREQRILLSVRDNGVGLNANSHEQIFVPFFTTKPGGSGIGLSLARQIAVAHGGTLDVQAAHPQGLALLMSLPLQQ